MPDVPEWIDTLVEGVARHLTAAGPLGPLGVRFREEDDGDWEVVAAKTGTGWNALFRIPIALVGAPKRGGTVNIVTHALDVDDSGSRLAMGSTTGGLWTSEDGGDSWEALDARLPPVYAVRFG